jgi:hypothetical protein
MSEAMSLVGDELLVSVFAQLPLRSSFRIVDESDIVTAFYQARQSGSFDELFVNYPFDTDGIEPASRNLTEALDSLQQARLLGRMNPDLIDYTISPALKIRFEKFVKPKVAGQEEKLNSLAEKIKEALNIKGPPPPANAV